VYDSLDRKLAIVAKHAHRSALLVAPTPHVAQYAARVRVRRSLFLPYAAAAEFGRHAA